MSLRKALALSTTNQVRNRIQAIRDVLEAHLRRGPNNQILLTDDGLALLRQLQELYDSGLTMTEASDVLRETSHVAIISDRHVSPGLVQHEVRPSDNAAATQRAMQDEISFLRARLVELEGTLPCSPHDERGQGKAPWWVSLREDLDVA